MKKALSFDELMQHQLVIYSKTFKNRVTCYITQDHTVDSFFINNEFVPGHRSQYLVIIIKDEELDRFVALRLSTFRKIIKWLTKLKFNKARRLTLKEKAILIYREARR
jgi:hypothetical protein